MLVAISIAALICGVCPKTLRRWETQGVIMPGRTVGGHRRYSRSALLDFLRTGTYTIEVCGRTGIAAVYGRVSALKQKQDLHTQTTALIQQAQSDGFIPKVYTDIGSGLNDKRPRFLKLLMDALHTQFDRLYITYHDRLARFGTYSYEELFRALQIPIICIQASPHSTLEEQLVHDVIAVITSFAGKIHRSRRGTIGKNLLKQKGPPP
jgi:predicted site-specific integrase-resolvase